MATSPRELREAGAFLRGVPERGLVELAGVCHEETLPAHTLVFKEGEAHPNVYLVHHGGVVLDMHVPGRGQVPILSLGPGDLLGCSPLGGAHGMTARATTASETSLMVIPVARLLELCERDHEIGFHVMQGAAAAVMRRLVATRLQLLDLFAETTPRSTTHPDRA